MDPRHLNLRQVDMGTGAWLVLLALAVGIYALGLDGQYVLTNGDELVYTHIARLTAASNQWLPLVSELDHMRNTKPPLLFWQAMVAGDWGRNWHMAALRTPSLIYTLLLAAAVAWSVKIITHNVRTACLAACIYLAFLCTFRFGRTFLTSAPETFWLSVPMFWLLWCRTRSTSTALIPLGWLTHIGFGLVFGLGLAYKSFALIAPAAAALWCAQLLSGPVNWKSALQITFKVSTSAVLALGFFALWFAIDPDPKAVWQEFVIGENAGKMSNSQGYWHTALRGGGISIWAQLLAYAQNAGLLAFVVLGLIWMRLNPWRKHTIQDTMTHRASPARLILLAWLAIWLLIFTLPSQRSARYVIPAMPALAILMALYWDRIARGWFLITLWVSGLLMVVLGRIAWAAYDIGIGTPVALATTLLAVATGLIVVIAGLVNSTWTRSSTIAACLSVFASFTLTTAPLNGLDGLYEPTVIASIHKAKIAVPSGFNGQFERFQFLLPGHQFIAYEGESRTPHTRPPADELKTLLQHHDAVIWLQSDTAEKNPPCVPDCKVLGTRWEVKGRHQTGEINAANFWYPQQWLFRREWLVALANGHENHARR